MYEIYVIQNKQTDKVYIGQSKVLKTRLSKHRNLLNKNKHVNSHLQYAWSKHGEAAFDFYALAKFESQVQVDEAEEFYIDWFKQLDLSYNLDLKSRGPGTVSEETKLKHRNKTVSQEVRQRISESLKGKAPANFETARLKANESIKIPVRLYNVNGELVERSCIKEFSKEFDLCQRTVSKLVTGKLSSFNGWSKDKMNHIKITLTSPTGDRVERLRIRDFCHEFGLVDSSVLRLLSGQLKTHKGWSLYE